MTHVFVVDSGTFKYHLEYMFAGIGAGKDDNAKLSPFLINASIAYPSTTERMLVGMIADISRIRIGDNALFYLQSGDNNQGSFFGVFKVASLPFFDENDQDNYLIAKTGKGLSFRVLIEPNQVFARGITEHEYLDSLIGKEHPCDLCWSLIYRKLKGKRGCTMITDYEFEDFLQKVKAKNNNAVLDGENFTYDHKHNLIVSSTTHHTYEGRMNSIDILPRLLYKSNRGNAFEAHLQAYLTQNIDKMPLAELLIPYPQKECWIGNEVSCGVGMQRIDLMLKQETAEEVVLRLIELKDGAPYAEIITDQIPWYLEWLSYYMIPKYAGKRIRVLPTVIANGRLSPQLQQVYQGFNQLVPNVIVEPLQYIGFTTTQSAIHFTRYL